MNKQLLAKWNNLSKVIVVVFMLTGICKTAQANKGSDSLNSSDSCSSAKAENVDIKLLKTTSDYFIISVSSNFSSADYSMNFANGQNEVLYTTGLPAKQFSKSYAITRTDDFDGLKLTVFNKKCNVSSTYDVSFVTKVSDLLLVSKN